MVTSRKIVYDTYRKFNNLNTGGSQSIKVIDVVSAINDAYEILVENNIKLADTHSLIRDNLRKLEIKNVSLEIEKKGEYYFAKYPSNLYKRLNHVVIASCDSCKDTKRIIPRIVQSDDLHEAKKNPYRKANFAWEQLIMDEAGDGLYIYTDNAMELDKVVIDYYRKINYIQAPSLVECSGYEYRNYDNELIKNDVPFDLDNTYIARKVSDLAVLLLRTDIKDTEAFNLKLQQILQVDKII